MYGKTFELFEDECILKNMTSLAAAPCKSALCFARLTQTACRVSVELPVVPLDTLLAVPLK